MKLKQGLFIAAFLGSITSLQAQVTTIPFEFNGAHLYIKAQTNQSDSLHFVFDTGATGGSIDSASAEKAGVSKENRQTVSVAGSGGSQTYSMALNQNLKLKGVEIKGLNLVLVNFNSLSAAVGDKVDGIVGYEILDKYVTQMDFDHKQLLLYNQIKDVDTTGYTGIPFEFSKSIMIPRFPISITLANGETFTGKVMFDTGNAGTLIVSTPFSMYHDFNSKLGKTTTMSGRGLNAVTENQLATIQSMSFNGFKFPKMNIMLTINPNAKPGDGYLGILGIDVIKHFNVILDYANHKIYLKPNQAYNQSFPLQEDAVKFAADNKAFLEKNKTKPGVKVTPSGLQYKIIKQGNGPKPTADERVSLHYTTTLIDGKKMWSTYDNKKPWVHHLDKALDGVKEAVQLMPAGSKWIVYIPASLAFGASGYEQVPGGATLIYELEVLKDTTN